MDKFEYNGGCGSSKKPCSGGEIINILITGCAGSTGHGITGKLLADGHIVTGIDNFFNSKEENLEEVISHENFTFMQGSILDKVFLERLQKISFDQVFHLAAVVETKYFYTEPVLTYETNCHGTKLMMDFAKKNGGKTIGFAGFDGGAMKELADVCVVVPFNATPHVEAFHVVLQHLIAFRLREKIMEL